MIRSLLAGISLSLALAPSVASAQVYVVPRRPGSSVVRNDPHQWRTIDLLVDEEIGGEKAGGVRLYFYESERASAELAAASIEATYRELVEVFGFTPQVRFPYVLYSSYQEFLRTNLFPMQEGVLGVTSPKSLEVTLPYFGDHERFAEVSRHELSHQFTIQKVGAKAKEANAWGDPVMAMPLWFVEGLAEYIARGELDDESRMLLRDLAANPDLYRGYGLPSFFDDYPPDGLWTYKVGQARCAFLDATYGAGTVQKILDRSPELVGARKIGVKRARGFEDLLASITGDSPMILAARFDTWIKREVWPGWLDSALDPSRFEPLRHLEGVVDTLDSSPDGELLLYRAYERGTGRMRLWLVDPKAPHKGRKIVADDRPGSESLHPVDPRSYDLGKGGMVYVSESRGRDVLWWREVRHEAIERDRPSKREAEEAGDGPWWKVKLELGHKRDLRLSRLGIVAAYSPSLSPDGRMVAFVGLGADGQRDVWLIDLDKDGVEGALRLTHDVSAERQLAWGPDGIVFNSDAEDEGRFHLFQIDPDGVSPPVRLTSAPTDHAAPTFTGDGRLVWSGWREDHQEIFAFVDGEEQPLTDTTVGLTDPAPGHDGGIWALLVDGGRRWPVHVPAKRLRGYQAPPEEVADVDPAEIDPTEEAVAEAPTDPPAEQPEVDAATEPPTATEAPAPAKEAHHAAAEIGPTHLSERLVSRPWAPPPMSPTLRVREDLGDADRYLASKPSNWRLENIFALIGAGGGSIFGQVFASATDVLRDHAIVFSGAAYGSFRLADSYLLYLNQQRRVTWGAGPFTSLRYTIDETFVKDGLRFQGVQQFYGGMISVRYPFNRFIYAQLDQSTGAVDDLLFNDVADALADGTANGTGRDLLDEWNAAHDHPVMLSESTFRLGYDTITYHHATGPLTGWSALLEDTVGAQPTEGEVYDTVRLDLEGYIPIERVSGANIALRGATGTSFGSEIARDWYLYGPYTLRGVRLGNDSSLIGRHFWFGTTELQVPLDFLVRVAFLSTVEGIVGLDMGGIAEDPAELWDNRVLDVALGTNLVLGPFVFRVHFARALDIGAPLPEADKPWVTNFSIGWIGE